MAFREQKKIIHDNQATLNQMAAYYNTKNNSCEASPTKHSEERQGDNLAEDFVSPLFRDSSSSVCRHAGEKKREAES